MHEQGLLTMSMREVDRMKVIQAVADGHLGVPSRNGFFRTLGRSGIWR
ncbi:hypothetical protein RSUY_41230 (plasmid) [Ralstonia solanacearum]|nr:hypothetical protein RSUY_41230 [Ralstonia solanacearum]